MKYYQASGQLKHQGEDNLHITEGAMGVPYPQKELTQDIAKIRIEAFGDDPDDAVITVSGIDRERVVSTWLALRAQLNREEAPRSWFPHR